MGASATYGLQPGLAGSVEVVVEQGMTAAAVGSGLVSGLATPTMVALMEKASIAALAARLPAGLGSVGTRIDVAHLAPTPIGSRVAAKARLDAIDGRRLTFSVTARDEVGEIGRGTHERYIVDLASFEQKMANRGRADR